jgi:hypothetical protein
MTMADPNVYRISGIEDIDGRTLTVGVDYDTVTIGEYRLRLAAVEELAALLVSATLVAARCVVPGA